jgi:hypothetical protein
MIERQTFINFIRAAIVTQRFDYARRVAMDWLATWPGDGTIIELLAEVEIAQAHATTAIERLRKLILVDPENSRGYDLLAKALRQSGDHFKAPLYEACKYALQDDNALPSDAPPWIHAIKQARKLLDENLLEEAKFRAQSALAADPSIPLAAVCALRIERKKGDLPAAQTLAEVGHNRWTGCLPFRFILAEWFLQNGEHERGVDYMHRAVMDDPTGRIACSWLDADHPYRDLWPTLLEANLSKPVPAEIVAVLGGNNLAAKSSGSDKQELNLESTQIPVAMGSINDFQFGKDKASDSDFHQMGETEARNVNEIEEDPDLPAPLDGEAFQGPDPGDKDIEIADSMSQETRIEFERLAAKLNTSLPQGTVETRMPAYIVLTSRTRLMQEFGTSTFQSLDKEISDLVSCIGKKSGWRSYKYYVDDPRTLDQFGLVPVDPGNAWGIKLQIADLDRVLGRRSEMIGAILIVGGNEIIPFHLLPNPTDDDDEEVQSDNPYGTTDENYFITEWPVGRFPLDQDPELLQHLLKQCTAYHRQFRTKRAVRIRFRDWLRRKLDRWIGFRPKSIGYSANIWKKASIDVFRAIGEPRALVTSPPVQTGSFSGFDSRSQYSYFNLHGLEDAPEWFGQRETSSDPDSGVEFPVALSPSDIINSGRAPEVVFSEACYGANVIAKQTEDALCLKFLASGSNAVVGSTKISYGSINPPLIAADLIGRLFWEQLRKGSPVGEALRRAKIKLAAEMHQRQGFLDGEDQKTLISFVLYGDPLYSPSTESYSLGRKSIQRQKNTSMNIKTACALGGPAVGGSDASQIPLDQVKSIMANYLPGMEDADLRVHQQTCSCSGKDHNCPTAQFARKNPDIHENSQRRFVQVTLSKRISTADHDHPRFARLTLNPNGKVIKLVVSR